MISEAVTVILSKSMTNGKQREKQKFEGAQNSERKTGNRDANKWNSGRDGQGREGEEVKASRIERCEQRKKR
jgi:hypothetical protein